MVWSIVSRLPVTTAIRSPWLALARSRRWQDRFQDYRAIAEGLRIQQYWQRLGVRETVADHYLREHRGELDWIRNTIRVCRVLDDTVGGDEPADSRLRRERSAAVAEEWIGVGAGGQIAYFNDRIARNKALERRWDHAAIALLVVSFLATLLAIAAQVAGDSSPLAIFGEGPIERALLVLISTAAAGAALAKGYAQLRGYGAQRKQYERMLGMFRYARVRLAAVFAREPYTAVDAAEADAIVVDLGEAALAENASWVMLHRERPLEYPRG